ncbi:hypothetical protein [Streptomyces sp. NPDC058401]|uniref:hypothetical protein n=1 Tax=Streptomyces sp. NPDC058401 TaxID=3346480 RepID=UPI003668C778
MSREAVVSRAADLSAPVCPECGAQGPWISDRVRADDCSTGTVDVVTDECPGCGARFVRRFVRRFERPGG